MLDREREKYKKEEWLNKKLEAQCSSSLTRSPPRTSTCSYICPTESYPLQPGSRRCLARTLSVTIAGRCWNLLRGRSRSSAVAARRSTRCPRPRSAKKSARIAASCSSSPSAQRRSNVAPVSMSTSSRRECQPSSIEV